MGEINRTLGNSGAPIALPIGDRTYYLSPLTKKIQGLFETWLEERALRTAYRAKEILPPEDYEKMLAVTSEAITEGYYSWGKEAYDKAVQSFPGVVHMLWLLMKHSHPALQESEVADLVMTYGPEINEAITRVVTGPKDSAPETGQTDQTPTPQ